MGRRNINQWLRGNSGYSAADFRSRAFSGRSSRRSGGSVASSRSRRSRFSARSRRSVRSGRSNRSRRSIRSRRSSAGSRRSRASSKRLFQIPVGSPTLRRFGGHDNRRKSVYLARSTISKGVDRVPSGFSGSHWGRKRVDSVTVGTPLEIKEDAGDYELSQWITPSGALASRNARVKAYIVELDFHDKPIQVWGTLKILFGPRYSTTPPPTTAQKHKYVWDHRNSLRYSFSSLPRQPIVLHIENEGGLSVEGWSTSTWQTSGHDLQIAAKVTGRTVNAVAGTIAFTVNCYLLWSQEEA